MNTTNLVTYIGIGQAVASAGVTYFLSAQHDGSIDFHSPVFWLGAVVTICMAVKAYFTEGIKKSV